MTTSRQCAIDIQVPSLTQRCVACAKFRREPMAMLLPLHISQAFWICRQCIEKAAEDFRENVRR